MLAALHFLPLEEQPLLRFLLYLVPYLTVGYDILRKAFKGILKRQVFDENFLMAVATIGAMAVAEYSEGVAVMWFYQIGELFQSYAVGRSRRSITSLMDIRPDYANIETDGHIEKVDPDDVEVGTVIVVEPGEKVPIDGVIVEGETTLNTAALTGESVPRDVKEGDEVLSGSINGAGLIRVRTTCEFEESTASKILDLVENASSRKSRSEQFITKFARIYTPAVCIGAVILAFVPPVIRLLMGSLALWSDWIYRALTFLVISCPCAIVVSIPLSFFGGIGGASAQGILIKGSNFMETLSQVKTVVFDKTGTITKGNFEVVGYHRAGAACGEPADVCGESEGLCSDEELLEYAALAESHSSHPISQSLLRAYGKEPDLTRVSEVKEISGAGVTALVDGRRVAAGNVRLMAAEGVSCEPCKSVGTIVYVAIDGRYEGHIVIADELKPRIKEALSALTRAGVTRTVMLTGDVEATAKAVAADAGIGEVHAELLPGDKVKYVEAMLGGAAADGQAAGSEQVAASGQVATSGQVAADGQAAGSGQMAADGQAVGSGQLAADGQAATSVAGSVAGGKPGKQIDRAPGKLAFVGDGINDAPVLTRADIGIAMGALGSDAAIEAADVVLMDDDPVKIAKAIRIARKCLRIVKENIWFAIGVKLLCLGLSALGLANMWLAIFADVGVMVLCVLNAIRCLMVKHL